jgi:biotin carboxylase
VEALHLRTGPHVWGYFSVFGRGAVHEFADSQFGHVFASGATREAARRHLVLALKELTVYGEVAPPPLAPPPPPRAPLWRRGPRRRRPPPARRFVS